MIAGGVFVLRMWVCILVEPGPNEQITYGFIRFISERNYFIPDFSKLIRYITLIKCNDRQRLTPVQNLRCSNAEWDINGGGIRKKIHSSTRSVVCAHKIE